MDLTKIMAVSGKPGLYRMLSQTKSGFIVESLADGKRFPVFAHEKVSSLEEISIFTTGEEDLPLKEVFRKLYHVLEGRPGPGIKAQLAEIKELFGQAVPDFDAGKVYISDMKKAIAWYDILLENQLLNFSDESGETGDNPKEGINNAGEETESGEIPATPEH